MKNEFSKTWKASTQPRKQRKYAANAPLHTKGKLLAVHLSKPLRDKHAKRNVRVRVGDKVKVLRGTFRNVEGKVERVDVVRTRVFMTKVESTRKDGTKRMLPIHPSNLMITELNLEDKARRARFERKEAA